MIKRKTGKTRKSRKKNGILWKIIVGLILLVCVVVFGMRFFTKDSGKKAEFQKGMGYVTWSEKGYLHPSSNESLAKLRGLGTDWVSILITWYQTTPWSGDIHRTSKTPSDEAIIHVIRKVHELGMKVMLKLHLDLLDKADGSWRGEIGGVKEADWDAWFRKYAEYVMYYADIAEKEKVEMICIGTELCTTATVKGYLWRDLIKKVRGKYTGKLTYAAHWDRYLDIRFWDLLDYVGINAYFPLTEKIAPTYDELKEGWANWVSEIDQFQEQIGKPIIFPETGCNSADGAAIRPWEHVSKSEVNLKLQEDYYRALLDTFWDKPWFQGLYWWYWGTNTHMGGKYNRGFTPQNKPTEGLIRKWYAKPAPR